VKNMQYVNNDVDIESEDNYGNEIVED